MEEGREQAKLGLADAYMKRDLDVKNGVFVREELEVQRRMDEQDGFVSTKFYPFHITSAALDMLLSLLVRPHITDSAQLSTSCQNGWNLNCYEKEGRL